MIKTICVYGASSNAIDSLYITAAERLGEKISAKGYALIFGGGASGVMGGTARGCEKNHGKIIGVAPKFFNADGVLFENCDDLIYTESMRERKGIFEKQSDAFIIAPGGIGTFDEFFEILTLKQLGRHNKPIAVYNVNGYYDSMINFLNNSVAQKFMNEHTLELFKIFDNDDDVLNYIENYNDSVMPLTHYKSVNNDLV